MLSPIPVEDAPILDPIDRNAEILFGVFMCLTFTGTLSAATAGTEEIRTMMIAAISCNAAWGFVDGVMYILRNLVAGGRRLLLVRAVRAAPDPSHARAIIAADLGPLYVRAMGEEGLERVRAEACALTDIPSRPALTWHTVRAALMVFALVFLSTFPLVLPFLFFDTVQRAMRISAVIAIAILFICGYSWGKYAGLRPWRVGLLMVVTGVIVELAVIALGG